MIRMMYLTVFMLSLAACTGGQKPVTSSAVQVEQRVIASIGNEQSLAELSLQNGVEPCPRFLGSLDAALNAIDAVPHSYPSMLR